MSHLSLILFCTLFYGPVFFSDQSVHSSKTLDVENEQTVRPNIIFIMADDAGWNDFSFHGSMQIPTPNIDALALNGLVLNSYYGSPLCTPTRGAIMTGKHPIHLGLQHYVIMGASPHGLPLSEKLLPEYLKELGYATHLVGKWHLGHASKKWTPTFRGFDSHFGYWLGKQDYYDHMAREGHVSAVKTKNGWGYDFRSNLTVNKDVFGEYDTDLFTDEARRIIGSHDVKTPLFLMVNHIAPHSANQYQPLQAPLESIEKFTDTIEDVNRRMFAGVMNKLDESVGLIVEELQRKGILHKSIIIFVSDNGGAPQGFDMNYGSNWPLRGAKNTLWEGGTRLAACIWSPLIHSRSRVSSDLMHALDWLPTLYEAAGGDVNNLGEIDGISQWTSFTNGNSLSVRNIMLYNIDDLYNNSAVRKGPWKLIQGKTSTTDLGGGNWDEWYGPSGRNYSQQIISNLMFSIEHSFSGEALRQAGFPVNQLNMKKMLSKSQINCELRETEKLDDENDSCHPLHRPCLFNIDADPCELHNLANLMPSKVEDLLSLLKQFNETAIPPFPRYRDPRASPSNWDYVWTNWLDY